MGKKREKTITLVLGGVRSGKSRYAQKLASTFDCVTFVATARPSDAEMRGRIAAHRRERPRGWRTVEAPVRLAATIRGVSPDTDAIVVDCLTLYLANQMSQWQRNGHGATTAAIASAVQKLCDAIRSTSASVILVSNEVGSGIVPAYASGRVYRDLLGSLNQRMAQIADRVVLLVAGLPLTVKGQETKLC